MGRYLQPDQVASYLTAGKAIDQWLGVDKQEDCAVIRWLQISKARRGFEVTYFESIDEDDAALTDVYAFSALDPDEPFGQTRSYNVLSEALAFCAERYACQPDRYLAQGMIQEVYAEYVKARTQ